VAALGLLTIAAIELHDDHVQWLRRVTLHDTKVRKKVIVGLSNILAAAGLP